MAVKKAAGGTKKKDASSAKKATGTKQGAATKAASKSAAPKEAAPKKAVKKASPALAKLSSSQSDLLSRIGSAGEAGYRSEKKAEQRSLDSLQEKKLIKKGAKDKATGTVPYTLSNAGKKHLASQPAAAPASGPAAATAPASSGAGAPATSGSPTPPSA